MNDNLEVVASADTNEQSSVTQASPQQTLINDENQIKSDLIKVESLKANKTGKNKKFYRLFPSLVSERVVNAFSCALLRNNGHLLLQGQLYLTKRYFAFHSNIFGYQTTLFKKWSDVTNIEKDKIALVFPTAISIFTKTNEKYFFASFLSRNHAFRSICKLWHQQTISFDLNNNTNNKKLLNKENSVYLDAINDENAENFSTATTSNRSSRSSSLVKINSSPSSSSSSLISQLNENNQFIITNNITSYDSVNENSIKTDNLISSTPNMKSYYDDKNNVFVDNEDGDYDDDKNQSFTSHVLNSIEFLLFYMISFLFLNRLQLFFQYLFMNSSINSLDDYDYDSARGVVKKTENKIKSNESTSNYLSTILICITIVLIMLTLYIYIFLIYFHVIKIESKLSEIQKLFNS